MDPNKSPSIDEWLSRLRRGEGRDPVERAVHAGIRSAIGADTRSGEEDMAGRRSRFFARLEQSGLLAPVPRIQWLRYGGAVASIVVAIGLVTVLTRGLHHDALDAPTERGVTDVLRIPSQNVAADTYSVRAELLARNISFKVIESSEHRSVLRLSISSATVPSFREWAEGHGLSVQGEGEYRVIIGP